MNIKTKLYLEEPVFEQDQLILEKDIRVVRLPIFKNIEDHSKKILYINLFFHTAFYLNRYELTRSQYIYLFRNLNQWLDYSTYIEQIMNDTLDIIYENKNSIDRYVRKVNKKYHVNFKLAEQLYPEEWKENKKELKKKLTQKYIQEKRKEDTINQIIATYNENKDNKFLSYDKITSLVNIYYKKNHDRKYIQKILNDNGIKIDSGYSIIDERLFYIFESARKYGYKSYNLKGVADYVGCSEKQVQRFLKKYPEMDVKKILKDKEDTPLKKEINFYQGGWHPAGDEIDDYIDSYSKPF